MTNAEDKRKKEKFEKLLKKDATKKTVSEILGTLEGTHIRIRKVNSRDFEGRHERFSSPRILTQYRDGMLLTRDEAFPNRAGTTHEYFLHRNGEEVVYMLPSIGVEHPNRDILKL